MLDMSEMSVKDRLVRNRRVVEEFRAHGGKIEGSVPLILLTTTVAKSGQPRTYPLVAVPSGDTYLPVSSKEGAPKNPLWYHNLLALPHLTLQLGNETLAANA